VSSQVAAIGDAIVADLTAQSWPVTTTFSRGYITRLLLESITVGSGLQCVVTPEARQGKLVSRALKQNDLRYGLVFLQRVTSPTPANLDALVQTVEAVQDRYTAKVALAPVGVSGLTGCYVIGAPNADPLYDQQHLDEQYLFLAVLDVDVEAWHQ
jgi:hypothetical protein